MRTRYPRRNKRGQVGHLKTTYFQKFMVPIAHFEEPPDRNRPRGQWGRPRQPLDAETLPVFGKRVLDALLAEAVVGDVVMVVAELCRRCLFNASA